MTDTEETIVVTVAPGSTIKIDPHPSGIPEVGPLILEAGATHRVSPEEAQRLYEADKILHPTTGEMRPAERRPPPRLPSVTRFETQEEADERLARARAADKARALRGEGMAQPRMVHQEGGWYPPPDLEW